MRLIDADEYKENLCDWCITKSHCPCGLILDLDNTPTAFDVDKVVEEIYEQSCFDFDEENPDNGYCTIDTDKAIDIVKRGGVDDEEIEWTKTE